MGVPVITCMLPLLPPEDLPSRRLALFSCQHNPFRTTRESSLTGFPNVDSYLRELESPMSVFFSKKLWVLFGQFPSLALLPTLPMPIKRQFFLSHSRLEQTHTHTHRGTLPLSRWFSNFSCWHRRNWHNFQAILKGQQLLTDVGLH